MREKATIIKIKNGFIIEYSGITYQTEQIFFKDLKGVAEFLEEYYK